MVGKYERNIRRGAITVGIGLVLGYALVQLAGCKPRTEPDIAPPITRGKCVADHYEGRTATKQVCLMDGFTWSCGPANCDRVGEAVGERPLPTSPATTPAPGIDK